MRKIWIYVRWAIVIGVLALPWVTGRAKSYNVYLDEWVEYAAIVVFAVFLFASDLHGFLSARARSTTSLHWPFLFFMGIPFVLCLVLYFLGKPIYAHSRFAIERPALEAYVRDGGSCPRQQCLSEGELTAFVWGANNRTWFGVCHDPQRIMRTALRAQREDSRAGRAPQPRVLGAVVTRAGHLSGDWYVCAASKRQLGVPLES
jgi:hypothetical protein